MRDALAAATMPSAAPPRLRLIPDAFHLGNAVLTDGVFVAPSRHDCHPI
jgi:hypothetical protein